MGDWISGAEAAGIIGVHRNTVYRSLEDEERRAEEWGEEGVGWRHKPLSKRIIFQVSRARAEKLAGEGSSPGRDTGGTPPVPDAPDRE
jgi:hypothetical protein